ncbi:esterase [Chromohalobacter marismortui]|uniref:Esterase n=1 Tax=Chromohalobacter marismortui TaxID=42055 RepID=A0A4R7NPD2_9GAMM|nr:MULTISPECIES: alpha/beta fold hydrolase [Chromohalobacter]MCI0508882.1 alpha/beta fold hydrolase [Chromohalobacter sp.]MCI0594261.1 alpha/beta fold hydrolase [Chromohalobacter sp.]TDU22744.1 esterase [Chromohalobacter marismortui]
MELHHVDTGGAGRPLVVLHGLFGSADNWRSHIKRWQESRRVIAVDLRNHGKSPHVAGMRYADQAADVEALLDRLAIDDCDLLGHSMGGKVAITLARQAPTRVARLIVADIAPIAYEHGHEAIFKAMRAVERQPPADRKAADRIMADFVETPATRQFLATNLVRGEDATLVWRVGLDEIENDYLRIVAVPDGDGTYTGPTLVLRGERSDYVGDDALPAIESVLPGARLETVAGAGHWLHAEQPEAFQTAVANFLAAE